MWIKPTRLGRHQTASLSSATDGVYDKVYIGDLSDGIDGVRETLQIMRGLVRKFRTDPRIRSIAENVIATVPAKDYAGEIDAMLNYVRDNIRYTLDTHDVEVLKDPITLINTGFGDCDDMSTLLATLLQAIGHPVRFMAVGFELGEFSHVMVQTKIGRDTWLNLDPTEPHPKGWFPQGVKQRLPWHI